MKNTYYKILFYISLTLLILTTICLYKKGKQKNEITHIKYVNKCKQNKNINKNNNITKVEMKLSNKQENKKKSYGMFAKESIKEGELIELCPILVEDPDILHNSGKLDDYFFEVDGNGIFPLGYGGMYNHSNDPNAEVATENINIDDRTLKVVAIKDIAPNNEVTISYGDDYWKTRNIKPI